MPQHIPLSKGSSKQGSFISNASSRRRICRGVPGFKHAHRTYMTCFGWLHVRIATCLIGLLSLIGVCMSLMYCVVSSQNIQKNDPEHRKPNYKLAALPMILIIITILYLFIGILQQKAKLLYPFVVLQIIATFAIAIILVMLAICALCESRYVVDMFIGTPRDQGQYRLLVSLIISTLSLQFCLQLWTTRAVCCCYRYFTDLARYQLHVHQYVL